MRLLIVLLLYSYGSFAQETTKSIVGEWLLIGMSAPDSLRSEAFENQIKAKVFSLHIADFKTDSTRVDIGSSCNGIRGAYRLAGNTLDVDIMIMSTVGCPGEEEAAEEYWVVLITKPFIVDFQENGFILKSTDGLYWLTFRDYNSYLPGKWRLTEISAPDSLRSRKFERHIENKTYWINIADQIEFAPLCNEALSSYKLQGDTISIDSPVLTLKDCAKTGDLEDYWFEIISQPFIIDHKGSSFILNSTDGHYRLTFVMMRE